MSKVMMSNELLARLQSDAETPSVNIGNLKGSLDTILIDESKRKVEFTTTNVLLAMDLLKEEFPLSIIIKYEDASLNFELQHPSVSVEFKQNNVKVILEEINE